MHLLPVVFEQLPTKSSARRVTRVAFLFFSFFVFWGETFGSRRLLGHKDMGGSFFGRKC